MIVKPYTPDRCWSADEYLAWESEQEFKNELIDNRVWIMQGADLRHNVILINMIGVLYPLVLDLDYELYGSRMCLEIDRDSTFVYPDMAIIHGEPLMSCRFNQHTFENPTVLFEILSSHTEAMDRGRKKDLYLQLESLEAYILVAQNEPKVEILQRQGERWRSHAWSSMDAAMVIDRPACEIPLHEVYRRVSFN